MAFKKSSITTNQESIEVDDCSFPIRGEATCLGYQWKQDLSSSPAIQNRIQRTRKAYFQFGSIYAFQGKLSPVSCCSIVETCVLPVLLYGVENWIFYHLNPSECSNVSRERSQKGSSNCLSGTPTQLQLWHLGGTLSTQFAPSES